MVLGAGYAIGRHGTQLYELGEVGSAGNLRQLYKYSNCSNELLVTVIIQDMGKTSRILAYRLTD